MGEFELYTGTSEEATSALVLFDIVHKTWLMSKRMRRSGKQVCDVVWGVSTISPSPRAHCLMVARPTPPPGSLSTWSDKVQIKQNLEISHLATSLSLLSLVLGIFLTLSIWQIMILSDHFHMISNSSATWSASTPSSSQAATVRYSRVMASLGSSSST